MGSIKPEDVKIEIPNDLESTFRSQTCICEVPSSIRRVNEAAYTPKVISIGPIHHTGLQKMERQKLRYLDLFCRERLKRATKEVVNDLSRIIIGCPEHIRGFYEEHREWNSESVKMFLLDAVFIIEFFIRKGEKSKIEDEFISGQPSIASAALLDLILLENQIPYFLLKRLYDETLMPSSNDEFDILVWSVLGDPKAETKQFMFEGVKHFLDLRRLSFLNVTTVNSDRFKDSGLKLKLRYSATKLRKAGVKFEAVDQAENWKLHVVFENGVLRIPVITVYDFSEMEFRNLMAFEQLHYPREPYICSFFFLLDYLINTGEDVEHLVDAGIIIHWHGSNNIFADFINKLCQGMSDYVTCYASLYEELNKYYEIPCNHRKATLGLVYFANVWRGTGTVAAVFLLLMTLIQTISSIKSFF